MKRIRLLWCLSVSLLNFVSVLADTETEKSSTEQSKREPLVYSNSYVYQHSNGTFETKMLTIASGKDGQYRYVKSDGKNVDRGLWKGPLPAMPHVDKMVAQQMEDVASQLSAVDALISSFDTSIEKYIKSLVPK